MLSALLVPPLLAAARGSPHGWAWAWWALALLCAAASAALWWPARAMQRLAPTAAASAAVAPSTPAQAAPPTRAEPKRRGHVAAAAAEAAQVDDSARAQPADVFRWRDFTPALPGYGLFGVGYIGYMTFVIALLRGSGRELRPDHACSMRCWAWPCWRRRASGPGCSTAAEAASALALLNALLGVATMLPAVTAAWPLLLLSGAGVRRRVPVGGRIDHGAGAAQPAAGAWAAGISAFTIVFAAGQIVGPTVVGWIADGAGGLERGLVFSAGALWLGALVAHRQPSQGLKADPD